MAEMVSELTMKRWVIAFIAGCWPWLAWAGNSAPSVPAAEPAGKGVAKGESLGLAPSAGLTEPILYQFLLAEIAAQRRDFRLASEVSLSLAQKTRDVRLARRATEFATHAHETARALLAAQLWLDLDPQAGRAHQTLILLLVGSGDLTKAKQRANEYLKKGMKTPAEVFPVLAGLFGRSADRKAGLDALGDLAAAYPDIPEVGMAVARAAWNAGLYERAEKAAGSTLKLKPDWEEAVLLRGQALGHINVDAALTLWADFLDRRPQATEIRLAYARMLLRVGRMEDARAAYTYLSREPDNSPEHFYALGVLALQLNDQPGAERFLNRALELGYADSGAVEMMLGQLTEGLQRYEDALQWYRRAVASGRTPEAVAKAALMLGKLKRVDEGRELLKRIEPESEAERVAIIQAEAQMLREAGRLHEAFEALDRGLKSIPGQIDLLYDRAMLAEGLNKIDAMERDLRQIIKLKPDHAHAYNALGYALAEHTNRVAEAVSVLEKALKLLPNDPFIMDSMGWALLKSGRKTEALSYLRRAFKLMPDAEVALHLGEALWQTGAREEARQIWEGSLKTNPDNTRLREAIGRHRP